MEYTNLPNFYTYTSSHMKNSAFSVEQLGRDVSTPGFSYPYYSGNYVLSVVRKGKGTLETDGKKYILSKNDAFLTLPNVLSIRTADTDEPWELCFVSFNGDVAKEMLEKTVFRRGTITANLKNSDMADEIIRCAVMLNSSIYSEFTLLECFFRFLSFIDSQKAYPIAEADDNHNKYVLEIKKYIQANYPKPIKISEIADKLSINRSHLYRIFKKEMGIGVEDYIINIRINHAKVLLKDTSLSVSSVGTLAGYKNYTTFFKRFKQSTGITPLEYRNSNID